MVPSLTRVTQALFVGSAVLANTQGVNKYTVAALIDVMPDLLKTVMDKHIIFASCKKSDEKFSVRLE